MNLGPILQRELRRQARQWPTYWLRVLGGALVLVGCTWGFAVTNSLLRQLPAFAGMPSPTSGRGLFVGLNKLMAGLVWLIGPLLTADCLAREKRDGTLGLLFLTPLRAVDVVVGLALSHALRALMVLLAAYPVLMLPVLLGGVTWADAARMFLLQLAVLGLALAAGVTASAVSREWLRTRLLAFLLTLAASAAFVAIYIGIWTLWHRVHAPAGVVRPGGAVVSLRTLEYSDTLWGSFQWALFTWVNQNLNQISSPVGFWSGGSMPGNSSTVLLALAALCCCSLLAWLAIHAAAVGLRRTWQRETSPPAPDLLSRTATSLTRDRLGTAWRQRRRRRLLELSPVAWLQGDRWSSRLAKWCWAGVASVVLVIAGFWYPDSWWVASSLYLAQGPLVVAVAFSAAASFRRERESGALELLLVTPLTPRAILAGRLRGLAITFGPALQLLTVAVLLGLIGEWAHPESPSRMGTILWIQFLALWTAPLGVAVLGLGFGLRWTGFLAAWYRAIAAWYLIPYAAGFGLFAVAALTDVLWQTDFNPWDAFSTWGWPDSGRTYYPTLMGSMVSTWWWPFMGLTTIVRIGFLWLAWRMGIRALTERLFLPRPRQSDT